ncbi:MAG: Fic family protein [Nanoarchaeota archaeon]|nr:Fic family protein [Nanoarchaeota archaeon]
METIIEINKKLGGGIINKGSLEFLTAKIESKYNDKDLKKQIAKIAAILWMDIIQKHPFLDGNKRTATEAAMLFLEKNSFVLETATAGKVYISLKIANNEIKYEELVKWIYEKITG